MDDLERIDDAMLGWSHVVPDLDVVTMRTALLFSRVAAMGYKHVEKAFADVGLSAGQFDVLATLLHAPRRTSKPSALAERGMLSPAGMTHRLDMLERAGLVERRPDPDDRRSTLVVLTAAGERRAVEAARIHVAAESELFDPLGPADLAALCGLLERMLSSRVFVGPAPIVTNDSSCRTDQRS